MSNTTTLGIKQMKKPLILIFALFTLLACSDNSTTSKSNETMEHTGVLQVDGYYDVTVAEAKTLLDEDTALIVIDVSPYWAQGHLPGAISLPLGSGALEDSIPSFDLSKHYLVYCHGDAPARAGAKLIVEAGASHVYRLIGNYPAWVDAGYPIEMQGNSAITPFT
jgi:rhodanese-related sulfurtransferase